MSAVDGENAIVRGVIESDTSSRSYMSALDGDDAIVRGVIGSDSSFRSYMSALDGEDAIGRGVIESESSFRSYISALDSEDATGRGVIESDSSCRSFSLVEIQAATNDFDDASIIGIGGFGKVYKGFIDNDTTVVAVKRLNSESKQGANEFSVEIKMLCTLQHTNLVALIGYCTDCEEKILVYEYISRGALADHLYKRSKTESSARNSHLSWEQRLEICVGVARGLDYIHTGTNQSFIHRDMKTTNILLDKNWVVKISDFGLSKGIESHSVTHVTTEVKGSFGYFDPEYYLTRRLTTKSDVYAFGVVLLEVLSGRQPVDTTLEEEKHSLVRWAEWCIKKGKLREIIDPSLSGQILPRSLNYFVKVAGNCLHTSRKARPTMAEVMKSLELALASQRKGKKVGIITKVFQGIGLVPKGMDHLLRERKDNDSSRSGPSQSRGIKFEEGWPMLKEGINKAIENIADGSRSDEFNVEEYMMLYTAVYNMSFAKHRRESQIYNKYKKTYEDYISSKVINNMSFAKHRRESQMYNKYKKTYEDYISSKVLPSLREKKDENLLQELVKRWNSHKGLIKRLSNFFDCLDRYYTVRRGLPTVKATGYSTFYELVHGEMNDQVRDVVISMINREREAEQTDHALVNNTLEIDVKIGQLLMEYLERILKTPCHFIPRRLESGFQVKSYKNYMLKVEECMKLETERASCYLQTGSKDKLLEVVERELPSVYAGQLDEKKQLERSFLRR